MVSDERILDWLTDNMYSVMPENVPTGGDDFDVDWVVYSYHMDAPFERVEGRGDCPRKAIINAMGDDE